MNNIIINNESKTLKEWCLTLNLNYKYACRKLRQGISIQNILFKTPKKLTLRKENFIEYQIWKAIKRRCYNKNEKSYKNYGLRGIIVCDEWKDSFETFLKDMGNRPKNKTSIDRIDPNKGYELSNCRWSTYKEQANNRRSNRFIEFNGKRQTLAQWGEELNIRPRLLGERLTYNWTIEQVLFTPVKKKICQ